jgi:hypothetical protein
MNDVNAIETKLASEEETTGSQQLGGTSAQSHPRGQRRKHIWQGILGLVDRDQCQLENQKPPNDA